MLVWILPYSLCTFRIIHVLCLNTILCFKRRCSTDDIKGGAIYKWQQNSMIKLQGNYLALKLYIVIGHVH